MINDYDTKLNYGKLNPKLRHFGVELEITNKEFYDNEDYCCKPNLIQISNKLKKEFKDFDKHKFIFKWDGSVTFGFEVVGPPLLIDNCKSIWAEFLPIIEANNFISYDAPTNGMHIHVSKGGLSKMQIVKIIKFVYNKDNSRLIRKIAQRHEKDHASFRGKRKCNSYIVGLYDRHTAINVCDNTLEFRLFRGTLSQKAFNKNLEFVNALLDFTAPALYSFQESAIWWNFMNFVRLNQSKYSTLWNFCVEKKMSNIDDWSEFLKSKEETKEDIKQTQEINNKEENIVF